MNGIATLGRLLYATALIILGVEHGVNANFPVGLLPVPAELPRRPGLVYMAGGILVIVGGGLLLRFRTRLAGLALNALFGLLVLLVHLPLLLAAPDNGGEWTAFFECVALSGGALVVTGQATQPERTGRQDFTVSGQWLFAVALVVFGGLHLIYAPFIATLIPGWIPVPLFWAYFVGIAFFSSAISIFINRKWPLASALLGLMFLLWVLLLHGPRVVANPQLEPEWTSLCVALAMSGSAFCVAGLAIPKPTNLSNFTIAMNTLLWIIQVFLTVVFGYSGFMKSTRSERDLVAMGQTGVEHLPLPLIQFIGVSELAGVAGLLLPDLLNYWRMITPVASGCLGLIMLPAGVIHYRRGEFRAVAFNVLVFLLCGLVAYGRGHYSTKNYQRICVVK